MRSSKPISGSKNNPIIRKVRTAAINVNTITVIWKLIAFFAFSRTSSSSSSPSTRNRIGPKNDAISADA